MPRAIVCPARSSSRCRSLRLAKGDRARQEPALKLRRCWLRLDVIQTVRVFTSELSEFVPSPAGLVAALARHGFELAVNSLSVEDARLVGPHLIQFAFDR